MRQHRRVIGGTAARAPPDRAATSFVTTTTSRLGAPAQTRPLGFPNHRSRPTLHSAQPAMGVDEPPPLPFEPGHASAHYRGNGPIGCRRLWPWPWPRESGARLGRDEPVLGKARSLALARTIADPSASASSRESRACVERRSTRARRASETVVAGAQRGPRLGSSGGRTDPRHTRASRGATSERCASATQSGRRWRSLSQPPSRQRPRPPASAA